MQVLFVGNTRRYSSGAVASKLHESAHENGHGRRGDEHGKKYAMSQYAWHGCLLPIL